MSSRLSGKVSGGNWQLLAIMSPLLGIIWGVTLWRSYRLNMMMFSQETSITLGLDLKKERLWALMLSTSLAAFSVVLVGEHYFVGLLSGHITRRFVGNDESSYLLAC